MDNTSEDEECRYFDAHEEIASFSGASSDCGNERADDSSCSAFDSFLLGNLSYGLWIGSPGNAKERRNRFLNWMGIGMNQILHENLVSVHRFEATDAIRIRDNSGAALRSLSFEDEFRSSRSSVSSWSNGNSSELSMSGLREHFLCRDGNLDSVLRENIQVSESEQSKKKAEVLSPCSQNVLEKKAEEQRDLVGIMKRVREKWLSGLNKANNRLRSEDYDGDHEIFSRQIQRVKVKQYKKRTKELAALYTGQEIQAHEGSILAMKFSPDGKYLASAGVDGIVRIWRVVEDERSNEHDVPEIDPSCMYFEVNNLSELKPLMVEKEKKTAKLMSPRKTSDSACVIFPQKIFRVLEKPIHEFHGHTGDILDISWSENSYLLSASVDKTVRLWRVGCDHCLGVFSHSNYVTSVQFNPVDDNYFMSGSIDGRVRIWVISGSQVVDWADVRDIVTAVCYCPDGQIGIVGTVTSNCLFYSISDNNLQLDARICLHRKKKSLYKRITGFQFFPKDPSRIMVISADSQVRILQGLNVVGKYKGLRNTGNQICTPFTSDGKHIISACEDSNIYMWNCIDQDENAVSQVKKIRSCERFSTDASVAIPWCGFKPENSENSEASFSCSSPSLFSLDQEFVLDSPKGSATWPEEKLSSPFSPAKTIYKSQYRFLRASCQSTSSSHLWGLVIVTGGWDGRIRSFHNYGLPIPV